jgi:hypothetical protein
MKPIPKFISLTAKAQFILIGKAVVQGIHQDAIEVFVANV